MTQPLHILIATYLEPELVAQIEREVPDVKITYRPDLIGQPRFIADHSSMPQRTPEQEQEWQGLLASAHILFDFDFSHREDLPDLAPNLRWIQGTSAGIGQYVKRNGYLDRTDWIFTTASGVHARPLAEFALMVMLMFAKDYGYLQRSKETQTWMRYCGIELAEKTLGIVGLGKIGRETARLAKAFDMRVIGTRRDPTATIAHVDQLYANDHLLDMLSQTDFLVLSCPHTPETEKMIGARELAALPDGAILINIARGAVVDQPALIEALERGHLGGAALDVTDPEPLPPGNPLWTMPNVIISPHSASTAVSENGKIVRIFIENLKRYLKGDPLINQFDPIKLY